MKHLFHTRSGWSSIISCKRNEYSIGFSLLNDGLDIKIRKQKDRSRDGDSKKEDKLLQERGNSKNRSIMTIERKGQRERERDR